MKTQGDVAQEERTFPRKQEHIAYFRPSTMRQTHKPKPEPVTKRGSARRILVYFIGTSWLPNGPNPIYRLKCVLTDHQEGGRIFLVEWSEEHVH